SVTTRTSSASFVTVVERAVPNGARKGRRTRINSTARTRGVTRRSVRASEPGHSARAHDRRVVRGQRFFAGAFFAAVFLAGAFFTAGAFLAGAFFAGAFLAGFGILPVSTASLKFFSGVIRATRFAFTRTVSPVAGLRARRAGRSMRRNFAKPEIATSSPLATLAVMMSTSELTYPSASLREIWLSSANLLSSWLRFTSVLHRGAG